MSKPMTKTQLVAALADEMGSDKKSAGAALDASRIALMVGMADAIMCPMPPGLLANDLSSANASSPRIGSL